jgi:hypothetical protein
MDTDGPAVLSGIVPDLALTIDVRHATPTERWMLRSGANIIPTMPASLALLSVTGRYQYF